MAQRQLNLGVFVLVDGCYKQVIGHAKYPANIELHHFNQEIKVANDNDKRTT